MSGGAWEYVMGNYNDVIGSSGFVSMPDAKYYDKYTSDNLDTACNGSACLSHGFPETSGWYADGISMASEAYPWLVRSAGYGVNISAGIFYLYGTIRYGDAFGSISYRVVLCI